MTYDAMGVPGFDNGTVTDYGTTTPGSTMYVQAMPREDTQVNVKCKACAFYGLFLWLDLDEKRLRLACVYCGEPSEYQLS